ncbi:GM23217 [Drosophila sechellia]|uniref:GM23217 n=1 Tax=Drosophila sechellia TaxID=7238 RepID=B4IMA4_DROSE|nr:GM23217 [Drosophila sechellia]
MCLEEFAPALHDLKVDVADRANAAAEKMEIESEMIDEAGRDIDSHQHGCQSLCRPQVEGWYEKVVSSYFINRVRVLESTSGSRVFELTAESHKVLSWVRCSGKH